MEVILSYLENMFLNMPDTLEVRRAKEELASMMEDKYNELRVEGKRENEAIGIVISEFGNLDELAEELGLKNHYREGTGSIAVEARNGEPVRVVDRNEADAYLNISRKTVKWIAFATALCISCPIPVLVCGGLSELIPLSDGNIVLSGLIPLFLMIGIAVVLFISSGVKLERFEYLKKENFRIDMQLERYLRQLDEEEKPAAGIKLCIGVVLCIFSAIPVFTIGSITDSEWAHAISVVVLLLMIACGVVIIILGENRRECIKVLLQEGEFTAKGKKGDKIVGIIAAVYWPIVVVIYLIWSFATMHWGFTWLVWPVAGLVFAAIASIVSAVVKANQK